MGAQAVFETIKAERRWCLTGTPVKKSELLEKPEELEVVDGDDGAGTAAPASSKVRSVVDFITNEVLNRKDEFLGKPHKVIVFSQFTSLLNLLQKELEKSRTPLVRLDGSMSHDARTHALSTFSDHPHVQVFICSLKA